jgi:hypothetical protein
MNVMLRSGVSPVHTSAGMLALIERSRLSGAAIEADVRTYNLVVSRQLVESDLAGAADTYARMQARPQRRSRAIVRASLQRPVPAAALRQARHRAKALPWARKLACGRADSERLQAHGIERDLVSEKLALELAELQSAARAAAGSAAPARLGNVAKRYSEVRRAFVQRCWAFFSLRASPPCFLAVSTRDTCRRTEPFSVLPEALGCPMAIQARNPINPANTNTQ